MRKVPYAIGTLAVLTLGSVGAVHLFANSTSNSHTTMGSFGKSYMGTATYASQGSTNWAGYSDVSNHLGAYKSIPGDWTVPAITGSEQSSAAQWIGLGGVETKALLQVGTVETIQNGQPVAELFWEKLPKAAIPIVDVPVGSQIEAKIFPASNGTWQLQIAWQNGSQSGTKNITVHVNAKYAARMETSAEWISEDPTGQGNQLYPLANMGTVKYTNVTVNGQPVNGVGATQVQRLAMVDANGNEVVTASNLTGNGTSFETLPASGSAGAIGGQNGGYGDGGSFNWPSVGSFGGASGGSNFVSPAQVQQALQQELNQLLNGAGGIGQGSFSVGSAQSDNQNQGNAGGWTIVVSY